MGFWKAEEFQKFAYPISEVFSVGLLSDEHCEAWECLARLVEFCTVKAETDGQLTAAIFQEIVQRYNILVEESQGLNSCLLAVITLLISMKMC